MAHVIAFANQKGGVAKTTSTINVGAALSEMGWRVLGVDMDPQANLTMCLGFDPEAMPASMYDVLVGQATADEIVCHGEIDVAVASIDLAGAELALSSMIGRERALQRGLRPVMDAYDYILIDTPPSLGLLTINALTAAESVIVPVQCEYLSLRGLAQLERTLEMIRDSLNPDVHIRGILPTMFDSRTVHGQEAVSVLKQHFDGLVFDTIVRKTIRFAEAPVQGCSILKYDGKGPGAEAYRAVAREVLNGKARQYA